MQPIKINEKNPSSRTRESFLGASAVLVLVLASCLSAAPTWAGEDSLALQGQFLREVTVPPFDELGPLEYAKDQSLPKAPPPNPQVGDSWLWWFFYHYPMPPHFSQMMCTVRGISDNAYVVIEDSQWEVTVFQDDVDQILERWENSSIGPHPDLGIYEINSLHFGDPPDELDDDRRIYLTWYDFGIAADGFFFSWDEYPDGTYEYPSNECEVLYLNADNGQNPSGDYMISVIAHEFVHLIHWKYDDDEDIWVDEGLAELAMWLYGRPDTISGFNTNPDLSLNEWCGMGEDSWPHYIKVYLWSLYFYERFGGCDAVYSLTHEPANSIAGYESVLDDLGYTEDFADIFADWAVANFLDDSSLGDGRFGYQGEVLPDFSVVDTYTSYPVSDVNATVGHWATDYYRFENVGGRTNLSLEFDGVDNDVFAVWTLTLGNDAQTEVERWTLDAGQAGVVNVTGLDPESEVVLVVARVSDTGPGTYSFNASENVSSVGDQISEASFARLHPCYPNPFNPTTRIDFDLSHAQVVDLSIYTLAGKQVATLVNGLLDSGLHHCFWNGRNKDGNPMPSGAYFYRLTAGAQSEVRRMVLVK